MIQSLNLTQPGPDPDPAKPAPASSGNCSVAPNPALVAEIKRRTDLLIEAKQMPEWIFLCGVGDNFFALNPGSGKKPLAMLFTSPHIAQDYIRVTKINAQVTQIPFKTLPQQAQRWLDGGNLEHAAFNGCPRCKVMNTHPLKALADESMLLKVWAMTYAFQRLRGEIKFSEFLQQKDKSLPQARAILELIRDHIDCSSPYLHELIAFHARMQEDDAAKNAAIERLKEFGPNFANWESKWNSTSESFSRAVAEAFVGLSLHFGIQFKPIPPPPSNAVTNDPKEVTPSTPKQM